MIATAILAAVLIGPPTGRPPMGPLERSRPRIYDVRYDVTINTAIPYRRDDPRNPIQTGEVDPRTLGFGRTMELVDTPIVMPLLYRSTFSHLDPDSIGAELWLGGHPDGALRERFRIEDANAHHGHLAVIPIGAFTGKVIRWNISFRAETFSSTLDDATAATLPWPREFPAEIADGLKPQLFIESADPVFKDTVERVSGGNLRFVTPYIAAKELVRYAILNVQVSGSGHVRGRAGVLHGLNVKGALRTAADGRGSAMDLVCVCVAMLRAAGIPARPVIGVVEEPTGRNIPIAWAEFYLHGAGWVPFDPDALRGKAIRNRDLAAPWPEFGTMRHLNRRIPLAYHFVPPQGLVSPQYPAVWGWDPRPAAAPEAEQRISISIVSRGLGTGDPR